MTATGTEFVTLNQLKLFSDSISSNESVNFITNSKAMKLSEKYSEGITNPYSAVSFSYNGTTLQSRIFGAGEQCGRCFSKSGYYYTTRITYPHTNYSSGDVDLLAFVYDPNTDSFSAQSSTTLYANRSKYSHIAVSEMHANEDDSVSVTIVISATSSSYPAANGAGSNNNCNFKRYRMSISSDGVISTDDVSSYTSELPASYYSIEFDFSDWSTTSAGFVADDFDLGHFAFANCYTKSMSGYGAGRSYGASVKDGVVSFVLAENKIEGALFEPTTGTAVGNYEYDVDTLSRKSTTSTSASLGILQKKMFGGNYSIDYGGRFGFPESIGGVYKIDSRGLQAYTLSEQVLSSIPVKKTGQVYNLTKQSSLPDDNLTYSPNTGTIFKLTSNSSTSMVYEDSRVALNTTAALSAGGASLDNSSRYVLEDGSVMFATQVLVLHYLVTKG